MEPKLVEFSGILGAPKDVVQGQSASEEVSEIDSCIEGSAEGRLRQNSKEQKRKRRRNGQRRPKGKSVYNEGAHAEAARIDFGPETVASAESVATVVVSMHMAPPERSQEGPAAPGAPVSWRIEPRRRRDPRADAGAEEAGAARHWGKEHADAPSDG